MARLLLLVGLIALAAPSQAYAQVAKRLTLQQYFDLEDVQDPRLSPDGRHVVYTRRFIDKLADRWISQLWIVDADGTRNTYLVDGSSPEWSPDGTRISYLGRDERGSSQVFVRWMTGSGEVTQVTRVSELPAGVTWSPDGRFIAFSMLVTTDRSWSVDMPPKPEGATWTEAPQIIERRVFRRDRIGILDDGFFHLFIVPSSGGTARQLTFGDAHHGGGVGYEGGLSWTPNGEEILFSTLDTEDLEYPWRTAEVSAINVRTTAIRQLTRRDGPDHNPLVSPDGRWVAYTGYDWNNDTYNISELYVVPIQGGTPRALTSGLDRSLYRSPYYSPERSFWWAPDSSGVFFSLNDRGTQNLYLATIEGEVEQVTEGKHIVITTHVNLQGRAVGTLTTPLRPREVVMFDVKSPNLQVLTDVNGDLFQHLQLGSVEEVWYESAGGFSIQGWILTPPAFDPNRKYPLILVIHGGPHGAYGSGFDFGWQSHAAKGYVVLYVNPRGSTGYGKSFGNAINNAYPGMDFDDLMAGVDLVIERGFIDQSRLYVYGGSAGGIMTSWIVGHTSRFAAASANYPVTNWISFLGTTDGVSFFWNFKKMFWDDPTEHLQRSPLMHVGRVTTPTMLMTGIEDLSTPTAQAEEFYRALKMRGIPTALVRFHDEFHGTTSKPTNFIRTHLYLWYWFDRFVKHQPSHIRDNDVGCDSRIAVRPSLILSLYPQITESLLGRGVVKSDGYHSGCGRPDQHAQVDVNRIAAGRARGF